MQLQIRPIISIMYYANTSESAKVDFLENYLKLTTYVCRNIFPKVSGSAL